MASRAAENGRNPGRDDGSESDTDVSGLKRLQPVLIVSEGTDALDSFCPEYACSNRMRLWVTSLVLIGCFVLGAADCYADWQAYAQLVYDRADPAPTFAQRWALFLFCALGTLLFLFETLANNLLEYCAMPHLDVELMLILVLAIEEIPLRVINYVTSALRGRAAFWAMFSGWMGLLAVLFLHGLRMYKRSYHGSKMALRDGTFYRRKGVVLSVLCHVLLVVFFVLTVVQTAHYTTHKV